MRIMKIVCISKKKKAAGQYVDLIFKVFEESSEINRGYRMPINDVPNWGDLRIRSDVCG